MNKTYFGHMSYLYGTDIEKTCIDLITRDLGYLSDPFLGITNDVLINPKDLVEKFELEESKKEEKDKLKGRKKEQAILELCFEAIDSCYNFVYVIEDGVEIGNGLREDLAHAIAKKKKIFRISLKGRRLVKMDKKNIINMVEYINKNQRFRSSWALKTIEDYSHFYEINKEAVELIKKQFGESIVESKESNNESKDKSKSKGSSACIPHYNSCFKTNNYSMIAWTACTEHQIKHAFIDPRKREMLITCPFTGLSTVAPGYSKLLLDRFDLDKLDELLKCSRTIHMTMNIFENSVFKEGIVLRDIIGDLGDTGVRNIIEKGGKSIADVRKIIGCTPIIDLDIKKHFKEVGENGETGFFNKEIFNEYCKAVEIVREYMSVEWPGVNWRLGFSGNGLYVILEKLIFEDVGFGYGIWLVYWKQKREKLEKMLKSNGVIRIGVEKKYGWNRYFKAMGTFHLDKDRIAIPLNKDIDLAEFYDWLKYHTDINNGLKENIFKEIMDRAGDSWK